MAIIRIMAMITFARALSPMSTSMYHHQTNKSSNKKSDMKKPISTELIHNYQDFLDMGFNDFGSHNLCEVCRLSLGTSYTF